MEERKLRAPEPTSLSEQMFLRTVCQDLENGRNFPANTTDAALFDAFIEQAALRLSWQRIGRRASINQALTQGRMRVDLDPGTARYILTIVERKAE